VTCSSTTHTECIVTFSLQQWFGKRITVLRYTYIAYGFLYIPVHPSQSQSTLYNHQSSHLPLRLLFLPVSDRLTAVPLLLMFSLTVGKSKCLYELSEMSYLYDFENPLIFGVPNRILLDTGLIKPGRMGSLYQWYSTFFVRVPSDIISLQLCTPKVVGA
jgi:hypothetical protein